MENVLKELDSAFRIISTIPVSGDNVEIMAAAKAKLRAVYAELSKQEGTENGG